jgi:hypothetical protein
MTRTAVHAWRTLLLLAVLAASLARVRSASASPALSHALLAKAQVDECFAGFGRDPLPFADVEARRCPRGATPRTNGAYVFSLARAPQSGAIWFGTRRVRSRVLSQPVAACMSSHSLALSLALARSLSLRSANQACTVIGTTLLDGGGAARALLLALGPRAELGDTAAWTCEFGRSRFAATFKPPPGAGLAALTPSLGDWRPPQVFSFDPATQKTTERTPRGEPLLNATLGMRSAGAVGDLVLMGGPNLAANFRGGEGSAIVLFAFRASTGAFLGARAFPQFSNIRRWHTWTPAAGSGGAPQLFTAVRAVSGARGRVLRWTGTPEAPFSYEEVGQLSEEGGYITEHAGRLFVSTWSDSSWTQTAGIWMSPPLAGATGLTAGAHSSWTKVFAMSDYDPDTVVATTQYLGALASFGDFLYVGSMTVPMLGAAAHAARRGPLAGAAFAGAARGIAVFRGSGFGTPAQGFELLYGERALPAWNGLAWVPTPTKLGLPLFGRSGFGNGWNTYTWSAAVHKGKLYMGTYDWSVMAAEAGMPGAAAAAGPGADLWRFDDTTSPAVAECVDGCGNSANYGIRNLLSDGATLYVGTANPMNRLASGGWELHAFK